MAVRYCWSMKRVVELDCVEVETEEDQNMVLRVNLGDVSRGMRTTDYGLVQMTLHFQPIRSIVTVQSSKLEIVIIKSSSHHLNLMSLGLTTSISTPPTFTLIT